MTNLAAVDPVMFALVKEEEDRQQRSLELIASENFTSEAVMDCIGSALTSKYSEGQPEARFYGGTEVIDKIENLCKKRALEAFHLDEETWGVNVQPLSGAPANVATYVALLQPHDRIMGLDLPSGGHLSHGFYTPKKKVSATSMFYESLPYKVDQKTGWLDFESLREQAKVFRPKLIIAGISSYPRDMQLDKFREICDEVDCLLMCDMAHISGLVAAGLTATNPFEYADVVTSTTHKTLRGPRAGMIFYNKKRIPNAREKIDNGVFPGLQGGAHNNKIGALAVQFKEVSTPAWKEYATQIIKNSKQLAASLMENGFKIVTDGTDNHITLIDLRPMGLTGSKFEKACEAVSISLNKNTIHGDQSAMNPSGARCGSGAMTTRGLKEKDFAQMAVYLKRVADICKEIQESHGKKLVDFQKGLVGNAKIEALKADVETFARKFPMPGRMLKA